MKMEDIEFDKELKFTVLYERRDFQYSHMEIQFILKKPGQTISEALIQKGFSPECYFVKVLFAGWPDIIEGNYYKDILYSDH
jgi:hypothetical protein